MAGFDDQNRRLLRVDTILNSDKAEGRFAGDPLLLAKIDGVEGISRLFAYDLIMLREAGGLDPDSDRRPPIDPTKLIGTHAEIGVRPSNPPETRAGGSQAPRESEIFFKRAGMFETFEDILEIDITKMKLPNPLPFGPKEINVRDLHIYRARIVPWVKVLSRDICYRIFEQKSVVQIIDDIADEAKKTFPHLIIDTLALKDTKFPPMEYCVQYGESTLEFISRLMQRFGIWYFFGPRPDADAADRVLNEAMILKRNRDSNLAKVRVTKVKIAKESPGLRQISKLVRRFRPPERRMLVGGFNYLDPTHPFYKDGTVTPRDDLLKNEGGPAAQTKFSAATSFAEPVFADAEADALAETVTKRNQAEVLLISGVSRNHSFIAGHSFRIEREEDVKPQDNLQLPFADVVDRDFVIDQLAITGNDYNYVSLLPPLPLSLDIAIESIFHTISALEADAVDATNNSLFKASLWATRTAQAKIYATVNPLYGNFADTAAGSDVEYAAIANIGLKAAMGLLGDDVPKILAGLAEMADFKKAVTDRKNLATMAVGVIAVPAELPFDPPLPLARRPVARGPHTAVVIGPDDGKGVDTSQHDIFCDAIGRVRVRFPWDPGPPQGGSKIPPVFPVSQSHKPTTVGGNTCWVRVVESWAGRHYGTQFLPRIGQEVVIDFLDGDPERPVIVGRLYNADRGTTNLPFPDPAIKDTQLKKLTDLPATAKFDLPLSGIKTASIPTTDKEGKPLKSRFHLLRFSDKRDHEQYLIRSQHRLDITAFDKRFESIGSDRHLTVGGNDPDAEPPQAGGDYIAHVFGNYHLHVGDKQLPTGSGNRITLIEKNEELQVKKDSSQTIGGNWSTSVGTQMTVNALGLGGTIILNASTNITLMVGASMIVINPAGIFLQAPTINLIGAVFGAPVIGPPAPAVPAIPLPPLVDTPREPTAADPGDTLDPPD